MNESYSNGDSASNRFEEAATNIYELSPFTKAVGEFDIMRHELYDQAVAMMQDSGDFENQENELYNRLMRTAERFQISGLAALEECDDPNEATRLIAGLYASDEAERIETLQAQRPHTPLRKVGPQNAVAMFDYYVNEFELDNGMLKDRYAVDVAHNLRACIYKPTYSKLEIKQHKKQLQAARRQQLLREIGAVCVSAGILSVGVLASYKTIKKMRGH